MSGGSVPNEIIDAIVDAVGAEYERPPMYEEGEPSAVAAGQSLANLSLASSYLNHRSCQHLFRHLDLFSYRPDDYGIGRPSSKDYIATAISIFQANPRLFQYIRELEIAFNLNVVPHPAHFLSALPFFLDNLKHLASFELSAMSMRELRTWSEFDADLQTSIQRCLSSNSLRSVRIAGLAPSRDFLKVLPPSLEDLNMMSFGVDENGSIQEIGTNGRTICAPTSMTLYLGLPFTPVIMQQGPDFFRRLQKLSVKTRDIRRFNLRQFFRDMPTTMQEFSMSYHVRGAEDLLNIHQLLSQDSPLTRFRTMPNLKVLSIAIELLRLSSIRIADQGESASISCPNFFADVVLDHLVPAFASIEELEVAVKWYMKPATLKDSLGSDQKFIDREASGFAKVDDCLSQGEVFSHLKYFTAVFDPTLIDPIRENEMTEEEEEVRKRLHTKIATETKEAYFKTAQKVTNFNTVDIDDVFPKLLG